MPRPAAVITGASSGIGAALARVFAAHGHELVLVARRQERLEALADDIAGHGRPRPLVLPLDLATTGVSARIADALAAADLEPKYMVNNAGFGLWGGAAKLSRDEQLKMIDLNIRTLVDLSLAFVDSLERHKGGILNLGSVAGFLPGPYMAVYYASKAFVLSYSEALRAEFAPRGIHVTVLCPGPVPTEFQARAGGLRPQGGRWLAQTAEQVAIAGYRGLMSGKAHVVPGWVNQMVTLVPRLVPRAFLADQIARVQAR
jgi:uncharacterized protein